VVVGVNRFVSSEEAHVDILKVSEDLAAAQIERTQGVRAERDNQSVRGALKRLAEAANGDDNTMPIILECVEAYATVGEIADILREAWGEYREKVVL
jgi:methylmalonyl-CoA mutase N-terminal domain/subunit